MLALTCVHTLSVCFLGRNVQLCDRHVGQTLKFYSCLLSCVFVFICSEPEACGSQGVWKFHEGVWCKNACLCLLTVNGSLKWNLFGCFRFSICPPDCSVYPHSHPSVEIAWTGDSVGKLYDTTPTPQQAHACWGKLSFLNLLFTSRFHASWWVAFQLFTWHHFTIYHSVCLQVYFIFAAKQASFFSFERHYFSLWH